MIFQLQVQVKIRQVEHNKQRQPVAETMFVFLKPLVVLRPTVAKWNVKEKHKTLPNQKKKEGKTVYLVGDGLTTDVLPCLGRRRIDGTLLL